MPSTQKTHKLLILGLCITLMSTPSFAGGKIDAIKTALSLRTESAYANAVRALFGYKTALPSSVIKELQTLSPEVQRSLLKKDVVSSREIKEISSILSASTIEQLYAKGMLSDYNMQQLKDLQPMKLAESSMQSLKELQVPIGPVPQKPRKPRETLPAISPEEIRLQTETKAVIEAGVVNRYLYEKYFSEGRIIPSSSAAFTFQNGSEAFNSLLLNSESLPEGYLNGKLAAIKQAFAKTDRQFFRKIKGKSYVIPSQDRLYMEAFYQNFNSLFAPRYRESAWFAIADFQEKHLNDILVVIDTKIWMQKHAGKLPQLKEEITDEESLLALKLNDLAERAVKDLLPENLQPIKEIIQGLKILPKKQITAKSWAKFAENWMNSFSSDDVILLMKGAPAKGINPVYFEQMLKEIEANVSKDLTDLYAGKALYLLGSTSLSPEQTLSVLNWWFSTKQSKRFPQRNLGKERTLQEYREAALLENIHRSLEQEKDLATKHKIEALLSKYSAPLIEDLRGKLAIIQKRFQTQKDIFPTELDFFKLSDDLILASSIPIPEAQQIAKEINELWDLALANKNLRNLLTFMKRYSWEIEGNKIVGKRKDFFERIKWEYTDISLIKEFLEDAVKKGMYGSQELRYEFYSLLKNH